MFKSEGVEIGTMKGNLSQETDILHFCLWISSYEPENFSEYKTFQYI